jgi:hypothetical protein
MRNPHSLDSRIGQTSSVLLVISLVIETGLPYSTHDYLLIKPYGSSKVNELAFGYFSIYISSCERKSQCCRQIERLGVRSHVVKVFSSICYAQPANTVNMPLRSS